MTYLEKAKEVNRYIRAKVIRNNLFGWRFYIAELQQDITLYIYEMDKENLEKGRPELGIGAYCRRAWQLAINYADYYSADKRKANFYPYRAFGDIDDYYCEDKSLEQVELLATLERELTKEEYRAVVDFFSSGELPKSIKALLNTPRIRSLLQAI